MIFLELVGLIEGKFFKSCPIFYGSTYVIPMILSYKVILRPYEKAPPQQQLGPFLDLTDIAKKAQKSPLIISDRRAMASDGYESGFNSIRLHPPF